jgi:hypothetical protein
MAVEVFISYRRNDSGGYALAIYRELKKVLPEDSVFYDGGSIDSGDDFPAAIEIAVQQCKVLLAVIAHDWLDICDATGKRRLDDLNDYVRREIALALRLNKIVIPVLCANVNIPPSGSLPGDIRALCERLNVHRLSGREFEFDAQLDDLLRIIRNVSGLAVYRTHMQRSGLVSARKLSCLCDRSAQDLEARETIKAQLRVAQHGRRPFVLVLHGPADEAHDAFVERLEAFSLPRLLQQRRGGGSIKFLPVFDALPCDGNQHKFNNRLREAMAHHLKVPLAESDDELLHEMEASRLAAAVAVLGWRASEVTKDPQLPFDMLFEYWASFPDNVGSGLTGCLVWVKYDRARHRTRLTSLFGSGRNAMRDLRSAVLASQQKHATDPRVIWRVLPELMVITLNDLSRWVTEVSDLVGGFYVPEERLQAIIGDEPRPMDYVRPRLEQLFPEG